MDEDQLKGLSGIKATLLLADYAVVSEGKLTAIGAGWSVTGPGPVPFAIAIIFDVPHTVAEEEHTFHLELIDVDGHPIFDPGSQKPITLDGAFQIQLPEGVPPEHVALPKAIVAINHTGLLLPPGTQMEWRLTVDDEGRESWRLPFQTMPANI